jgi:hypothetical protein
VTGICVGVLFFTSYKVKWLFIFLSLMKPNFVLIIFFRGRHASKVTEEEEDEVYLKEEEDALAGTGGTRLVSQPSCEFLPYCLNYFTAINITDLFVYHFGYL